jgi:alcohol dehydrogenase (cytochrome c)
MLPPKVRLRSEIAALKVVGQLPQVSYPDLVHLLRPSAGFDLPALKESRNPSATIALPPHLRRGSKRGAELFASSCSQCHGPVGEGALAPSLIDATHRAMSDWKLHTTIRNGVDSTAMRPTGLSFDEAWEVLGHIRAMQRAVPSIAEDPATRVPLQPVTAQELEQAEPGNPEWLSTNGGWSGHRNRQVPELDAESIRRIGLAWAFQLPNVPAVSQSTPLAVRGLLLITTAEDVIALDQRSGSVRWQFHRALPSGLKLCCPRANRGVAVLGTRLFVGTLDAQLIALNLTTGRVEWEVSVGDPAAGFSITSAPFVAEGRVVVGVAGGDFGARGFLDAYDAQSGQRIWRFRTVPDSGDPGSDTWPNDSTRLGGGTTWVPGAYDPQRHLLYWGVGNPFPNFAPDLRPGDNLYTNSVVAIDIWTGRLKWHYQFTPNDSHDWDSAQTPVLTDAEWNGRIRPLILWANRNGFFYVLDRESGEYLRATSFVRQTWNDGFEPAGRPIARQGSRPTPEGAIVYPGLQGGTSWWPPAYSDRLGMMFVAIKDGGALYFRDARDQRGLLQLGRAVPLPGEKASQAVVAIDHSSGKVVWRTEALDEEYDTVGGLIALGDRLVLGGQSRTFCAFDARTGKVVWSTNLGAPISAAPIAFRTGGEPRIAIAAGSVLFVFALPSGE